MQTFLCLYTLPGFKLLLPARFCCSNILRSIMGFIYALRLWVHVFPVAGSDPHSAYIDFAPGNIVSLHTHHPNTIAFRCPLPLAALGYALISAVVSAISFCTNRNILRYIIHCWNPTGSPTQLLYLVVVIVACFPS